MSDKDEWDPTNGWFFTKLPRRCPKCDRKPVRVSCMSCAQELPLTKNRLLLWLDRWSSRLACLMLITAILGVLAVVNAWLYVTVAEILS